MSSRAQLSYSVGDPMSETGLAALRLLLPEVYTRIPWEGSQPGMKLTQTYLDAAHKKALQAKARAHGTKLAEEVRRAVDAYLSGVSPEELRLLDEGS